jgi:hypothetical protein
MSAAIASAFLFAACVRVLAHMRWAKTLARDTTSEAERAEYAKAIDALTRRVGELELKRVLR